MTTESVMTDWRYGPRTIEGGVAGSSVGDGVGAAIPVVGEGAIGVTSSDTLNSLNVGCMHATCPPIKIHVISTSILLMPFCLVSVFLIPMLRSMPQFRRLRQVEAEALQVPWVLEDRFCCECRR
jgi:hypothetical protein